MANIQFWLSFDNGAQRLRLPVNPEVVSIVSSQGYNDVRVAQLGEITIIGDEDLTEFSFNSFFPKNYHPSYCEYTNIPDPWQARERIESWRKSGKPCRLAITGTPINYAVTIRTFDCDAEKAGNVGDIYYSLSFKEYKFIEFRKVDTTPQKAGVQAKPQRPNPAPAPTSYTVSSGDSLSAIAAKMKAKGVDITWQQLYEKNKSVIGKDPNKIFPNQKLVV